MTFEEYRKHDAIALAELIKKGEITATEIAEIAIKRAEYVNPKINAIVHPMYDMARQMAQNIKSDSPLAGVPFLIKDLGIEVEGVPKKEGSKAYSSYISKEDSWITTKFRDAGLVFMGKTNTPELGLTPYTEPEIHGPCLNPWDTTKTTGGSSGGSAAAVAAGITPIATASDGGGSIRIPASCCGLFGLKPSRGRISMGPVYGEGWSGAVSEGCVSRSVRDSAHFLDLVSGPMPGDPFVIAPPSKNYADEVQQTPPKLKIGYSASNPLGKDSHPDIIKAIEHSVKLLESLGHSVEEVPLPYHKTDLTEIFIMMSFGEGAATVEAFEEHTGRKPKMSDMEPSTWALNLLGQLYKAKDYVRQRRKWDEICRRMGAFHTKYDLLLTPTVSMPPFPTGSLQPTQSERRLIKIIDMLGLKSLLKIRVDELAEKIFDFIPHTPISNMTGQPSASVPLYWTDYNLPVGSMFTAAFGREDLLFQLSGQLERAQPWFNKVPAI